MALDLSALLTGINASIAGAHRGLRAGEAEGRQIELDALNSRLTSERIEESVFRRQEAQRARQAEEAANAQRQSLLDADTARNVSFLREQLGDAVPPSIDGLAPAQQEAVLTDLFNDRRAVNRSRESAEATSTVPSRTRPGGAAADEPKASFTASQLRAERDRLLEPIRRNEFREPTQAEMDDALRRAEASLRAVGARVTPDPAPVGPEEHQRTVADVSRLVSEQFRTMIADTDTIRAEVAAATGKRPEQVTAEEIAEVVQALNQERFDVLESLKSMPFEELQSVRSGAGR